MITQAVAQKVKGAECLPTISALTHRQIGHQGGAF
jgi:hypothetical protein